MADWRLFIAVELPSTVIEQLEAVQRELRATGADVKWTRPEQMHLTLKFLGDMPEELAPDLSALLSEAAEAGMPAVGRLGGLGAFPNLKRPRVVWAALEEPTGELAKLQARIEQALSGLVEPDGRPWSPHLTLGRTRSGRNVQRLAEMIESYRLAGGAVLEVPIREAVLFRSQLRREGPLYTPVARAAIGSG